jgi:hypothetical protein
MGTKQLASLKFKRLGRTNPANHRTEEVQEKA